MTLLNRLRGKPEGDLADDTWADVPFASPLALLNVNDGKRLARDHYTLDLDDRKIDVPEEVHAWLQSADPSSLGAAPGAEEEDWEEAIRRAKDSGPTELKPAAPAPVADPEEPDWEAAIARAKAAATIPAPAAPVAAVAPAAPAAPAAPVAPVAPVAKAPVAVATPIAPAPTPAPTPAPIPAPTPAAPASSLAARISGAMGRWEDEVRQRAAGSK